MGEYSYPRLVDQDSNTTEKMRHILSYAPDKRLCGLEEALDGPVIWGPVDCVVCMSLWYGMSYDQRQDLIEFWRG